MIFARAPKPQLGDTFSDLSSLIANAPGLISQANQIVTQIQPYMGTVQHVLEDPALPAVVARVQTIRGLEVASAGGAASSVKGVGLKRIVPALDAYIWYRKNPWITWAALGVGALAVFSIARR